MCSNIQHVRRDNIWEMSNLICGKAAVGGNYNSTHDTWCEDDIYNKY